MAEEAKKEVKETILQFSVGGGMVWSFPKDAKEVSRKEAYTLLGMVHYAEKVLLNMLEQPTKDGK